MYLFICICFICRGFGAGYGPDIYFYVLVFFLLKPRDNRYESIFGGGGLGDGHGPDIAGNK